MARRLYLDASVLNRPFDDQRQIRIKLEAEAVVSILQRVEAGAFEMIRSAVLDFENGANPFLERRERISSYLAMAKTIVEVSQSHRERAVGLEALGIMGIDALHLACAEGVADTFLTVDDKLLKRASRNSERIHVSVVNPVDFVRSEDFPQ